MSREDELLWYRDKLDTYSLKGSVVHSSLNAIANTTVSISDETFDFAVNNIWSDSRYEEEEAREEVIEHFGKDRSECRLFDEYTLAILSAHGFPEREHHAASYMIDRSAQETKRFAGFVPSHTPEEIALSLNGLRENEINWLIGRIREDAEKALETLRDVATRLARSEWQMLPVSKTFNAGPVPEELWNDVHKEHSKAPVLSEWWLTQTTDAKTATFIMAMLDQALEHCTGDVDMPDPLRFFSSHSSNHVDLIYKGVDESEAVA